MTERSRVRPVVAAALTRPSVRPLSRGGFTLVELLVIGIIALLISILLPAMGAAQAQAQSMRCKSSLRQLGIAWANYAVASKGWIQNLSLTEGPAADGTIFVTSYSSLQKVKAGVTSIDYNGGYLSRFMSQTDVARNCPMVNGGQSNITGASGGTIDKYPVSYAYSPFVVNANSNAKQAVTQITASNKANVSSLAVSMSRIRTPSETFWFADSAAWTTTSSGTLKFHSFSGDYLDPPANQTVSSTVTYTTAASTRLHGRHRGKANVLWFDGHVDEVRPNFSNTFSSGANTPDNRRKLNMGDLMPPGVDYGDPDQNYYFWKNKSARQ